MGTVPGVVGSLGKPMPPRTPIDGALVGGTGMVLGMSLGVGLGTNTAGVKSVGLSSYFKTNRRAFFITGRALFE